ncbi:MAG: aspartate--tRNA(Asn) ligase [Desulfurococcales archaeon]|nr:aspartate--tRNA(Asn) ligase [Desulfurococcales archaeon]
MYKKYFIADLVNGLDRLEGSTVRVCGWLHNLRDVGRIKFLVVRDRTGTIQAVFKRGCCGEEEFRRIGKLRLETVLCVEGVLARGRTREGVEVKGERVEILSEPVEPLPLEPATSLEAGLATRLNYRWLDTRNPWVNGIFRFEALVAKAFRDYFRERGFVEIFTSKIVAAGTESGAEVFPVIYFGREAYLAQSPQFYKQMAVIGGFERVFEIGPVFRAEPHHTTRHLTEYHSLDIEMGFIEGPEDVMAEVEGFFRKIKEYAEKDPDARAVLEQHGAGEIRIPRTGIPRLSIRDAYKILEEEYGKHLPWGEDLDSEAERLLGEYASKTFDSDFIFITEYPWNARPFYTMRLEDEPDWTTGFDLLYRGLEVVTGSQREHRYEVLVSNLHDKGLNPESFKFYLDFFKHGAPPHGGAGMGLERIVMQTLRLNNIREARLLPRDPERLLP